MMHPRPFFLKLRSDINFKIDFTQWIWKILINLVTISLTLFLHQFEKMLFILWYSTNALLQKFLKSLSCIVSSKMFKIHSFLFFNDLSKENKLYENSIRTNYLLWTFSWFLKVVYNKKDLLQVLHSKGFPPLLIVWSILWNFTLFLWLKDFLQMSHLTFFLLILLRFEVTCIFKWAFCLKVLGQIFHLKG